MYVCMNEVEKTFIFTQNWLDHLLLMTLYLASIEIDHPQTCLKIRVSDEWTATKNVRC